MNTQSASQSIKRFLTASFPDTRGCCWTDRAGDTYCMFGIVFILHLENEFILYTHVAYIERGWSIYKDAESIMR